MSDVVNVVVIGCGIFGAEIAVKARQCGLSVAVYEAGADILAGASKNNQNRLHLGFHYPRDLETGRQSIRGFNAFKDKYSPSIEAGFQNAYFIAAAGSHTSPQAYLEFCERLGAAYRPIAAADFPVPVTGVSAGIVCDEVVYDCGILKKLVWQQLDGAGIDVVLGGEVTRIERTGERLTVFANRRPPQVCDVVVNASYANINFLTEQLGYAAPERLFEYTVVPIVRLDMPKVGITIMDGPFMTLLPHGKSSDFLLYNVEKTVVAKSVSAQLDQRWLNVNTAPFATLDKVAYFKETIAMCRKYVAALDKAALVGFLESPRMVLARRDDTDARPSIIDEYDRNYFTVFSGKIDHCMWVADEMQLRLRSRFNL